MEQLLNTDVNNLVPAVVQAGYQYIANHNMIMNPKEVIPLAMSVALAVLTGNITIK